MAYPSLDRLSGEKLLAAHRSGEPISELANELTQTKDGPDFDEALAADAADQAFGMLAEIGNKRRASFDSRFAPILHETLNISARIAGDADFWRWFTFEEWGGAEIVDARYGRQEDGNPVRGSARPVYYGLEALKKGMFAKLWICANAMWVPGAPNPYDGIEVEDVDLWDSHIVDVDFASVPQMARAFVRFIRDENIPRGQPNQPEKPLGFRDLAKEIRRRYASIAFELLDDDEASRIVENIWEERAVWGTKS